MCKSGALAAPVGRTEAQLPRYSIAALAICNAAHFYSLCNIFSYAAFLSVDNGWVEHVNEAGFIAGMLPTAVMAGRIVTGILWGMLNDRFGGRACIIASIWAVALGNVLFGMSTWLWAALVVRFVVIGMGNGWVALIGPMSQELAGAERQSEVLALIFSTGPLVGSLGPALGGLLYGTLFPSLPALSPSLVGAAIAVLGIAAMRCWMPRISQPAAKQQASTTELTAAVAPASTSADGGDGGGGEEDSERESAADADAATDDAPRAPSLCAVLCSHPLPLVCLVRSGCGCIIFGMFDCVPLWLVASRDVGGLAMDEKRLGAVLAFASLLTLPWSVVGMGRFIRRFGVRFAMRSMLLAATVAFALMAPVVRAADAGGTRPLAAAVAVVLLQTAANVAAVTAGTATFAATNNACAKFPARKGAISGMHVTCESIGKMLGPAVGAPLLGWLLGALRPPDDDAESIVNGASATLWVFAGACLLCWVGTLAMPRLVDGPRRTALLAGGSGTRSDDEVVK